VRRPPDFVIERLDGSPYLRRWWIIPRNRWLNIYLHNMLADDDDRALHDHPWLNVSIVLRGGYWEIMPERMKWRGPGAVVFRRPTAAHRIMLDVNFQRVGNVFRRVGKTPAWSLFITGPRTRNWGFHCPQGWVRWEDFTAPGDKGKIGKGCGE
jgi:hypothetical protein